eukprot:UN13459
MGTNQHSNFGLS